MLPKWYLDPHKRASGRLPASFVLKALAREFGLSPADLRTQRRRQYEVRARQIGWYVMSRNCKQMSLPMMARFLGRQDHTTALHGIRKIEMLISTDKDIADSVRRVEDQVRGY